jgi:hypothetical protein
LPEQGVYVYALWFEGLPTRKGEQMSRQCRRPLCADKSLIDSPYGPCLSPFLSTFDSFFRGVEISNNDGQEIVEIVRDPSRKLADRFHFLRLI